MDSYNSLEEIEQENIRRQGAWVISFADTLSLMTTFFILLYSLATPSTGRFHDNHEIMSGNSISFKQKVPVVKLLDSDYLHDVLKQKINNQPELANIFCTNLENKEQISFPGGFLFEKDTDEFTAAGQGALYLISSILLDLENRLDITYIIDSGSLNRLEEENISLLYLKRLRKISDFLKSTSFIVRNNSFIIERYNHRLVSNHNSFGKITNQDRVDIIIYDKPSSS